jgi:uncharacterized protein YndB with AHSA1/START domain
MVNRVEINATPEQIWAALEDASSWPRWARAITNVEWTSPRPFGLGTTRTVSMIGKMTAFEEFVSWEPCRRMGFRFNESTTNGVRAFAERYTLDPVTPTRTSVTWVMAMAPAGVSKAIVPVTRPVMQRAFGRWLRRFATLVESEYVHSA